MERLFYAETSVEISEKTTGCIGMVFSKFHKNGVNPGSYTQLDVYKRQILEIRRGGASCFRLIKKHAGAVASARAVGGQSARRHMLSHFFTNGVWGLGPHVNE